MKINITTHQSFSLGGWPKEIMMKAPHKRYEITFLNLLNHTNFLGSALYFKWDNYIPKMPISLVLIH